jgi:hypothetical protein
MDRRRGRSGDGRARSQCPVCARAHYTFADWMWVKAGKLATVRHNKSKF